MPAYSVNILSINYWRTLLRQSTWRQAKFSLYRVTKDKRARKHLLRFLLQLASPVFWLVAAAVLVGASIAMVAVGGAAAISSVAPLFGICFGLAIGALIHASRREAAAARMPQPLSPDQLRSVHAFFVELALIFAVLADRANSEAFLKEKVLPYTIEIISRRVHIELLKSRNLWDKLSPSERQVLMIPGGEWPWPTIHQAASFQEQLRLVRWILRLDFFLPDLGLQPQFKPRSYKELILDPKKLLESPRLIRLHDLEAAREAAKNVHLRCAAEEIIRGYHGPEKAESAPWAQHVSATYGGKQSEDLLIGDTIVSEVSELILRQTTILTRTRTEFLTWAGTILDGSIPPARLIAQPPEMPASTTQP